VTGLPATERRPAAPVRIAARSRPDRDTLLSTTGLLAILLGIGLSIVDFFIVNIALPTIDRTLHPSPATLELVVAAYGIAYGMLLVLVLGGRRATRSAGAACSWPGSRCSR
jgi:MFS family permease